ncbi:RHS repeat-associated core domain-containing protein [Candidatus Pacearchaeota archaeon]|nr:RHS repeat-associated core domain-containing protein [Candidatus Pacearchaeota archaeon]
MKRVLQVFSVLIIAFIILFLALNINLKLNPTGKAVETASEITKTTSYIQSNGLIASYDSNGEEKFYINDHLGGTSAVLDENKNKIEEEKYFAFGEEKTSSGERFTYTGKEKDDSGLYYYGARYYDAGTGRFLQADPLSGKITNPQSLNKYVYVTNNPMRYTDPSGMKVYIAGSNSERKAILGQFQKLAGDHQLQTEQTDEHTIRILDIPSVAKDDSHYNTFEMLRDAVGVNEKFLVMFGEENVFMYLDSDNKNSPLFEISYKNEILPVSLEKIKQEGYMPISLSSEQVFRIEREFNLDMPLYIALAHELFGHGLDYHYNPLGKYDCSFCSPEEEHATFIENIVRKEFGVQNRPLYTLYHEGNSFLDGLYNINDYGLGGSILIVRPREQTKYPYLKKEQESK